MQVSLAVARMRIHCRELLMNKGLTEGILQCTGQKTWASTAGKMQMIAGGTEAVSTAGQVTRYKHGSRW